MKLSPHSRATLTLARTSSSVTLRNSAPRDEAPKLKIGSSSPVRPSGRVGRLAFTMKDFCREPDELADKQWPQMPLVQVLSDVAADDLLIGFQKVEVNVSAFRCELEGDVQQLPKARIEKRVIRNVPQRSRVLLTRPASHFRCCRQLRRIDIDHGGVRRGEFINVLNRVGINLPGQLERLPACLCQADQLLEPGRPCCFHVNAGIEL